MPAALATELATRGSVAGMQKCCLPARYHFADLSLDALEPYCADLDDTCSCNHMPPQLDAGSPDAGSPDAGSPDAAEPVDEDGGI